jgi:tetratricopeptide (TPR) repeat protein
VRTPTQIDLGKRLLAVAILAAAAACLATSAGCNSLAANGMNAEGVRLFEQANYREAIYRFHKAIEEDPKNADGYYNLASAYHRLGTLGKSESDWKQADQYYRMCLDHDPNHQNCHRGLAVLLADQGRADDAFKMLEEWAKREPTLPAPRLELARLHEEHGNTEEAKRYLLEALATDPDNARALAALGRLREQTGETVQALANYQRSLWNDRFQPEVAARVDALKAAVNPRQMITAPPASTGGTQVVTGGSTAVR